MLDLILTPVLRRLPKLYEIWALDSNQKRLLFWISATPMPCSNIFFLSGEMNFDSYFWYYHTRPLQINKRMEGVSTLQLPTESQPVTLNI